MRCDDHADDPSRTEHVFDCRCGVAGDAGGHRVEAAGVPRVAAADPPDRRATTPRPRPCTSMASTGVLASRSARTDSAASTPAITHLVAADRDRDPAPRRERRPRRRRCRGPEAVAHARGAARRTSRAARRRPASRRPGTAESGRRDQLGLELAQRGAQPAADPVARHGVADAAADRERHLGGCRVPGPGRAGPSTSSRRRTRARARTGEGRTVADAEDQAERRGAPAGAPRLEHGPARRGYASGRRNPCFFLRFRLFGWKVRFTHGLLERGVGAREAGRRRSRTRNGASARGVYWAGPRLLRSLRRRPAIRARAIDAAGGSATRTTGPRPRTDPDTLRATVGRLPHDPRDISHGPGDNTTNLRRNYSRETRDCSLERPGVGC